MGTLRFPKDFYLTRDLFKSRAALHLWVDERQGLYICRGRTGAVVRSFQTLAEARQWLEATTSVPMRAQAELQKVEASDDTMHKLPKDTADIGRTHADEVMEEAARRSLKVHQLASGIWHIRGPGVDIRTSNIRFVQLADLAG